MKGPQFLDEGLISSFPSEMSLKGVQNKGATAWYCELANALKGMITVANSDRDSTVLNMPAFSVAAYPIRLGIFSFLFYVICRLYWLHSLKTRIRWFVLDLCNGTHSDVAWSKAYLALAFPWEETQGNDGKKPSNWRKATQSEIEENTRTIYSEFEYTDHYRSILSSLNIHRETCVQSVYISCGICQEQHTRSRHSSRLFAALVHAAECWDCDIAPQGAIAITTSKNFNALCKTKRF